MGMRTPGIAVPVLEPLEKQWHQLSCELVTPLYGGGVEAATVDVKMPIRVSAIRGQLRFWWRLLAKHQWKLGNTQTIQQAEFALWGGMGDDSGRGRASQVFLRVHQPRIHESSKMDYEKHSNKAAYDSIGLSYVMFPETNSEQKHDLWKVETSWIMEFAFSPILQHDQKSVDQVLQTLRWWANFGGLGARTRRGLGAVHVSSCDDFPEICQPLTEQEVSQAGCRLKTRNGASLDALNELRLGVTKLSEFRQKARVGRNEGKAPKPAGRSRWPEPDALRRIQGTHAELHVPEHTAGNIFPRALFGLPIIFHFVGHKEPKDSQLAPTQGERLASPLIIRPFYRGLNPNGQKQWAAAALVLPYAHLKNMQVSLGGPKNYPVWTAQAAEQIKPIHEHKGMDPLDAFLNYFA